MRIETEEQVLKLLEPPEHFIVARSMSDSAMFNGETVFKNGILKKTRVLLCEWELAVPVHLVEYRENGKGRDIIKSHSVDTSLFRDMLFHKIIEVALIEKMFDESYYFRFSLSKTGKDQADKLNLKEISEEKNLVS